MSSTSPRQGLSKTLRSIKARFIVGFTLVLLAAVFGVNALTANLNAPLGQTAGSFTANVFSLFGASDDRTKVSPGEAFSQEDLARWEKTLAATRQGDDLSDAPAITFANPAPITIADNAAANPYPSAINVTGLVGSVAGVTVTINSFSHTFPGDVGMVLVGPGGQAYLLQGRAGSGDDAANLTYTLSDAAGTALPGTGVWANGTFRPAAYSLSSFAAPGPLLAYSNPGPVSGGSATLNGTFGGTNPNGNWNLFVRDFAPADVGAIAGGWSIDIALQPCAAPPANMVAWYPGEVGADDIIGDPANNGTTVGNMFYNTGKVGNGFQMNGTNAYVQVPPSAALNVGAATGGISIDAWINPANLPAPGAPIVEWNTGTVVGAHFWHSVAFAGCAAPGGLYVNLSDTAGVNHIVCTTTTPVTAGVQQHVAFTYDKATGAVALYHNGVAQATNVTTLGTGFTPQTGAAYSMFLGARPSVAGGGPVYFNGVMDEVEIFNRALSGAEVASINTAGSVGKCHVSQIQFDVAAQSVPENGGSAVTTLKRVGANDSTATVAYNVADGTATGGGVDYGNASTSIVTFAPGERTQTVSVPIVDDAIDEVDETFTATVSLPTGAGVSIGTPQTQTITIVDNDAVPVITIDNNLTGIEGNPGPAGSAVFTVTKTGATTLPSSVVVTPTSGTATGGPACTVGIDFINTPTTLTFPASNTTDTQTVTVNFCADTEVEADQTFTMVLTPTGATAGAAGDGLIRDDDSTVQFTSGTFSVVEGTIAGPGLTTFNISVSRTGGAGATGLPAATVDASTIQVGGSATGENSCAIAGADYIVVSGQTLSWGAGVTGNMNLQVSVCADSLNESNENFNAQLSNAVATTIGAQASSVNTITDDDAAPTFNLTGVPAAVVEGNSGTTPQVWTITRSGNGSQNGSTITWSIAGTGANPASVTGDVGPASGSVTVPAGTGGTFTFTTNVVGDLIFEANETYTATIAIGSNGTLGGSTSGQTTITNDDGAPTVAINDVTQAELNSGSSAFIFTVTRTGDAQANQTMVFSTANGGGPNVPATAPSDYTAIAGDTLTFTPGQTTRQIAVIVNGDNTFEDNENFTVNLSGFNFGSATDATGLGTITNDDAAPTFTIGGNVTVTEGNSGTVTATFTITKGGNATELTSIVSATTADGPATAATGGAPLPAACVFPCDYNSLVNEQVATFAPGDPSKTFSVNINPDTIFESNENFTVTLTNVTNGTFGTPITAQGTINNDDIAPVFTVAGTQLSPTEGSAATFSIVRSFTSPTTGTALASTVTCTPTAGTAIASDFGSAGTASFTASPSSNTGTCSVNTTEDANFEGPETFTVAATVTNGTVSGGPFTVTIINNDNCTFTASSVMQAEGNAGTSNFVHNVTKACTTDGTSLVSYASSDGTAVNPVDYTEIIPGTLAFLSGTTTLTLPVSVNGDLTVEADETYNVLLTGATVNGVVVNALNCGVATCGLTNGLGTILNDDGQPITISGTITNFGGGAAAGVTVQLTGSATQTVVTNASGQYSFGTTPNAGLPSGGNFLVTPTAPAGTVASPTTRSYTGITASVTNANFVLYQSGAIPRTLNVVNSYVVPGSPVTVPIMLTAQGDEAALSGTLNYAAPLSGPTVACGTGSPNCGLTFNTGTPGVITFSVEAQDGGGNPTVYAAGNRVVINVTFNTAATAAANAPVTFANAPTPLRTSDSGSNPLPTVYNNGFVVFQQGMESDVAPRPSGDLNVVSGDVVQTRRFVANLDTPNPSTNEFQRADAAPAGTKGNGALDSGDVVQARRYAASLDPTQSAGGPFTAIAPRSAEGRSAKGDSTESVNTILRTVNVSGNQGTQVFVDVELDSVLADDVAGFGTSFTFEPAKVSISSASGNNPDVTLGADTPNCAITTNGTQVGVGRIGIVLDCGQAIAPGTNRKVARLRFTIGPNAAPGLSPVNLVGAPPIPQSMSNTLGGDVTFSNQNGNINIILNPTAAGVTVGGRVTTPAGAGLRGATVSITDSNGVTRTVTTSTFGYYQFEDVEAGGNYVVSVASRRYRFSPRLVQVVDNLTDVDFQGGE